MRILVLGSGGREHAIVWSLAQSDKVDEILVAPGNGGTAQIATNINLDPMDPAAVVSYAQENRLDLVVIGPEAPLIAGVGDALRAEKIPCFGPSEAGAQLEGSKQFSKGKMDAYQVPTARYGVFTTKEDALAYLDEVGAPIVVKADGLAAGKGVIVAATKDEAIEGVEECFSGLFGDAGNTVVIEEMLTGPECSLLIFTDGESIRPMAPAQDHKRALEGDKGPNTGGMGVYSPVPIVTQSEHEQMIALMERMVSGLRSDGIEYCGVLYGGFMLTPEGPKVLEFNARFGDPETQVILPRLKTDLSKVLLATALGQLHSVELEWSDQWAVSVVLASGGYPGSFEKGFPITGIEDAEALPGVTVFHAGTALNGKGEIVTSGGRVLNVTALGDTFEEARDRAYEAADKIDFEGKYLRRDIGAKALRGRE